MQTRVLDGAALGEGEVTSVQIGATSIALYRADATVFATSNICTHQYALMSDGYFDGAFIECPLHQALFDVRTGAAVEGPVKIPLQTYPAQERDGGIFVTLPDAG